MDYELRHQGVVNLLCSFIFQARCTSLYIRFLTLFLCDFVLFHSFCSHAQLFGITLVHEYHIFCSHTEWNLQCFLRSAKMAIRSVRIVAVN